MHYKVSLGTLSVFYSFLLNIHIFQSISLTSK